MRFVRERLEIVAICQRLYNRQLIAGPEGNVSVRVGDLVLCTPSGKCKGFLSAADLVVVDLAGGVVEGHERPTSELSMHLALYRARQDVAAIVHAHPPFATAFALTGTGLPDGLLSEVELFLGPVVRVPYRLPGSTALAEQVRRCMPAPVSTALLQNHGAVTLGPTLERAWQRMEVLEAACRAIWYALPLNKPKTLPKSAIASLRRRYTF